MTTTITVRIDQKIARRLSKLAKERDEPKSQLIQNAIEEYLEDTADYSEALRRLNGRKRKNYTIKEAKKHFAIRSEIKKRLSDKSANSEKISHEEFWARALEEK
ncbi:MAG: ribbon-helix-helix protein, CopG family [Ignavibacteriales bacterium]|nr:ribbon-helix-helix protein, CopG family [Ignavibacteriales bacterium]